MNGPAMTLTLTATADGLAVAAQVLLRSVQRGDFDEDSDFEDAAAIAGGRFEAAAYAADEDAEAEAEVTIETEHLDEILAVIETDRLARSEPLSGFLAAANAALADQPDQSEETPR